MTSRSRLDTKSRQPAVHSKSLASFPTTLYHLGRLVVAAVVFLLLQISMGLLAKVKGLFSSEPVTGNDSTDTTKVKDAQPSAYPPATIDWTKWEAASVTDSRSPCPMINALCNHHILPHDGREITKEMAVNALTRALNLDSGTAGVFASQALTTNPDKTAHSFDLNHLAKHGTIEHDVSLSRNDAAFGDNHSFDPERWASVMASYHGATSTSFESVSKARYQRVKESKAAHDEANLPFQYGIKELILSYGESALFLSILGDPENGRIPLEYVRVLFEENRVPYKEGWRKYPRPITQLDMAHLLKSLIAANEEKLEEAQIVEMGTIQAVHTAVQSLSSTMCNVM